MPKKTKKEKIIAEYHRRLARVTPKSTTGGADSISPPTAVAATYRLTPDLPQTKTTNEEIMVYPQLAVIKKDLIKTLVLSAAAITVELILSWRFS